jgi:hypothetical protein
MTGGIDTGSSRREWPPAARTWIAMTSGAFRISPAGEHVTALEERMRDRRTGAVAFAALALTCAAAAVADPALRGYCVTAALPTVGWTLVIVADWLGARADRDLAVAELLVCAHAGDAGLSVRGFASRRHVRSLERGIRRLLSHASRPQRREVFQTSLVASHHARLSAIAAALAASGPLPVSAIARIHLLIHAPGSPLLTRHADPQRFAAWLRPIEHDLGLPSERGRDGSPSITCVAGRSA